jgi:hypothetical protein
MLVSLSPSLNKSYLTPPFKIVAGFHTSFHARMHSEGAVAFTRVLSVWLEHFRFMHRDSKHSGLDFRARRWLECVART